MTSRRLRKRDLLAFGAVVAALSCAAAVPASAQVPRSFYGIVPINELSAEELDKMGAANVGTLRQLVLWPEVEPQPDSYDWSYLDFLAANAADNGIEILPFVAATPNWVGVKCGKLNALLCQLVPPLKPKRARAAWIDFLVDFVTRYGPQGTFWSDPSDAYDPAYLPITRVQCWNEPSSQTYFRPRPDAKKYAQLLKLCDQAIASVDPSIKIVTAGLFPSPELGKEFGFVRYLEQLFDAKGIGRHFDEAAFHPYARTIARLKNQIKTMRKALRKGGVGKKPLWISEVGWGSDPPVANRPLIKGIDGQRELLEQSFKLLADRSGRWNLAGVLWYAWRDPGYGYENCPFCSSAGLFKENGTPKPAWDSYVEITGGNPDPPSAPPQTSPPSPPPPSGPPIPPIVP